MRLLPALLLVAFTAVAAGPALAGDGREGPGQGHGKGQGHEKGKDKDKDKDKGRAHAFGQGRDRIPPGHLPGPGECRLWYPDRPPGHQPPPYRCGAVVPVGAWVLQRPAGGTVVEAVVYDTRRPGVVVNVGLFDAASGSFLRVQAALR